VKDLVEYLTKSLVEHPDRVIVLEDERKDALVYRIQVDPTDVGRVIGRHGRIARSIRSVVGAAAYRSDRRVIIDIDSPEKAL
jgi:uncharacterized protein